MQDSTKLRHRCEPLSAHLEVTVLLDHLDCLSLLWLCGRGSFGAKRHGLLHSVSQACKVFGLEVRLIAFVRPCTLTYLENMNSVMFACGEEVLPALKPTVQSRIP